MLPNHFPNSLGNCFPSKDLFFKHLFCYVAWSMFTQWKPLKVKHSLPNPPVNFFPISHLAWTGMDVGLSSPESLTARKQVCHWPGLVFSYLIRALSSHQCESLSTSWKNSDVQSLAFFTVTTKQQGKSTCTLTPPSFQILISTNLWEVQRRWAEIQNLMFPAW